jgi:hypothetical protein
MKGDFREASDWPSHGKAVHPGWLFCFLPAFLFSAGFSVFCPAFPCPAPPRYYLASHPLSPRIKSLAKLRLSE